MYGIDLLIEEHKNILKYTEYLRGLCCEIIDGREVDVYVFRECIDFGRNYADRHHHGKEEKILFRIMSEQIGTVAENLIKSGMMVEHDLGRYYVSELERSLNEYEKAPSTEVKLDIITYASGYGELLKRHIEKEDGVVYTFADRMLSQEQKKEVDDETLMFERKSEKEGNREKYIEWLKNKMFF